MAVIVVEIVHGTNVPIETSGASAIEVVRPGGTVVNVQSGTTLPDEPYEGQVFVLLS